MSTDLQERPSGIYDDEEKRAKEQEHLKQLEDDFAKPTISDEGRNAGGSSDNPTDLKSKEQEAPDKRLSDKKSDEQSSATNEGGENGFFRNKGNPRKGRFSIKGGLSSTQNKVAFGIAAAIVSVLALMITWLPNFLINHLKEVLLGRISSVQMYHQRRYRQKKIHKLKNWFSADGRRAQTIIDEMKLRGYDISFDNAGDLIGLKHPEKNFSATGEGIAKEIDDFLETRHPFRTARWKTKRMEAFYRKYGVKRTSPIDADKIRAGPDGDVDAKKTVNKELAEGINRGEDPANLDNLNSGTELDSDDPNESQALDDADAQYKEGSSEIGDTLKEDARKLEVDGADIDELSETTQDLLTAGDGLSPEAARIGNELASAGGAASKVADTVRGELSPLSFADRLCTVRNRINGAVKLARAAKAVKLIRYAMLFVNAADDTRRGKGSSKAIGELMKRVTAKDANGRSIGGSPGFGYLMKSKFSKSKNNALKSPVAVDGVPSGLFGSLNGTFKNIPFMQQTCPFAQNPFVQTGAAAAQLIPGAGQGLKLSVPAIKTAVKKAVESATVRSVLFAVGQQVAIELTFDGIMSLTEAYIQKNLNLPFTGQEKGGELGDILVAGAGASNKQRSLEAGMVPAETEEYVRANNEYLAWKKEEDSKKSFINRTFAMDDSNSLMFNLALAMPMNGSDAITDGLNKSISVASSALNPSSVITSLMTAISPKASALDGDEIAFDEFTVEGTGPETGMKLATDPAGNPQVIMRSDIEDIDPVENEAALVAAGEINATTFEPTKDSGFAKHIEKCVDTPDLYTSIEDGEGDCMAREQITKRYKAQLAYLDLKDGIEAEFFPEDIHDASESASSTEQSPDAPVTTGVSGAVTIEQTSPIPGTDKRINTAILPQFLNMVNAAKADGIDLLPISSGWRDPAKQIALRKSNCPDWRNSPSGDCNPPTAKPGTSKHEGGRAIDFSNMCYSRNGASSCRGNARWEWLVANAEKYGFYQLKSEAWHWSTSGG